MSKVTHARPRTNMDGLYVQCNQPPMHRDSEQAVRGRKEVNGLFLSGLHWDTKEVRYARRNEKRGVVKKRFREV